MNWELRSHVKRWQRYQKMILWCNLCLGWGWGWGWGMMGREEKSEGRMTDEVICMDCTRLLSPPSSSMAVRHHGPCLLTLGKWSRLPRPSTWGNFSAPAACSTRPTPGCGVRSTTLWAPWTFFWQLSRDENLYGSGVSCTRTASPKPSFRGPWRQAMPWSAEEMLDGQRQEVGIPAHARTAHSGLLQNRLEVDLCWTNGPPPPNQIGQWTELNRWTES